MQRDNPQCVLFDWGNTVMRTFPQYEGPMRAWPRVEALPGIEKALRVLASTAHLALATNAGDSDENDIRQALDRCSLSQYFEQVFCFRNLGFRKPEPEFFTAIHGRLRLPVSSVYMVGDDFDIDVASANAVGLPAVWLNARSDQRYSGPLYRTIHQLCELPAALNELGATVIRQDQD